MRTVAVDPGYLTGPGRSIQDELVDKPVQTCIWTVVVFCICFWIFPPSSRISEIIIYCYFHKILKNHNSDNNCNSDMNFLSAESK